MENEGQVGEMDREEKKRSDW